MLFFFVFIFLFFIPLTDFFFLYSFDFKNRTETIKNSAETHEHIGNTSVATLVVLN